MECEITQGLARSRTGEAGTTDVRYVYGLVGLQLGTVLPSPNVGLIAAKIHATLRYSQLRLFNIQLTQNRNQVTF